MMCRNPLEQFMINDIFTISFPILSGNKLSLTNIGLYLRASARLLLELVVLTHGSSYHAECVAYLDGGNNSTCRKERGTIACYVKWVIEGPQCGIPRKYSNSSVYYGWHWFVKREILLVQTHRRLCRTHAWHEAAYHRLNVKK